MSEKNQTERRWLLRLQSAFVLPLARGIFLVVALGCLLAVIGGSLYLVYLQTSIAGQPATIPVPAPYQGSAAPVDRTERMVDLAAIGIRLRPPANIRFAVAAATLTEPPGRWACRRQSARSRPPRLAAR